MELPLEILLQIALSAPHAWMSMLAIPAIGRWGRKYAEAVMERFIRRVRDADKGRYVWILPNGARHSVFDRPAVEYDDGRLWWYKHGLRHRGGDLPAITDSCHNTYEWYKDGTQYRECGPAYVSDDLITWFRDGKEHRDSGPAHISDIAIIWFRNGIIHRDDGPAMIYAYGPMIWYKNGAWIEPELSDLAGESRDDYRARMWREHTSAAFETYLPK